MPVLRRVARPALAAVFIYGGINELRNADALTSAAQPVLDQAAPAIDKVVENAPLDRRPDNETLVKVDAGVKIVAGSLLALGKFPRLSATALAASLVPTTLAGHRFWEETDQQKRANEQIHFLKNVGLLGGLLIAAADTHGKPSHAYRTRRAAERAQARLSGSGSDTGAQLAAGLAGAGTSIAAAAAGSREKLAEAVEEYGPVVRERATEWGGKASEQAAHLSEVASDKASTWSEQLSAAAERTSQAAQKQAKVAEMRGA